MARPFERFTAWQRCHELVLELYRVTAAFPTTERYGLISQVRRAAFSSAANIAEGSAKRGSREFRRFLDISLGSLEEIAYALILARDLRYLTPEQWARVEDLRNRAGQLTWRLCEAVAKRSATR